MTVAEIATAVLKAHGVEDASKDEVQNVETGTFSAIFFPAGIAALELEQVILQEI
jgi:hypothetical protein